MEQTMIIRTKEASEHKSTLIFVHGRGDDPHDWATTIRDFRPKEWSLLFPMAKLRPITSEDGRMIKAWFDQPKGELDENEDEEGIKQASAFIMKVVDEEMQLSKIPSHQIFLGGFGQGGALALYTTLTSKIRFAGVICLSGWLPLRSKFPAMMTEVNKEVPMHLSHGETDRMVPFSLGQSTYAFLRQIGCSSVYFKRYPNVGHHKTLTQLKDFQRFINTFCPVHQPRSQS